MARHLRTADRKVHIHAKETIMETPERTPSAAAASHAVDETTSTAHSTIDKVSNAAHPAVDRITASAHQAVDKMAHAANTAAETLGEKGEKMKEAKSRMMADACSYVQTHPFASVGMALAAGFLLSHLLGSSRRSDR
jgi:ElaB/YqjD/DUF883 family membrane-anchored ribosome-binding protein